MKEPMMCSQFRGLSVGRLARQTQLVGRGSPEADRSGDPPLTLKLVSNVREERNITKTNEKKIPIVKVWTHIKRDTMEDIRETSPHHHY